MNCGKQAGEPQGKDQEFYLEAERELKEGSKPPTREE
jgi:hypothetical protein